MKNLLTFFLLAMATGAISQVPNTNVYLFDCLKTEHGKALLTDPRIITSDNLNGYNNQPSWFSDDEIHITQQKKNGQLTNLIRYDLDNERRSMFTKTSRAEYSPTLTPDGQHVSCIRVEADGTQVLWQYPLDRSHGGKRILTHIQDIGYHLWINETELVLFIVGSPHQMIHANTLNENTTVITSKIGRCFGKLSSGEILFVYKYTDDIWHLKAYIPSTGRSRFVAETVSGSEDFTILEDDTLVMGSGSKLYQLVSPYQSWEEIGDLQTYDIHQITRLAYRKGQMAIVSH